MNVRTVKKALVVLTLTLVALSAGGGFAEGGTPAASQQDPFLWGAWIGNQFTGQQPPWDWNAVTKFEARNAGGRHISALHWGVTEPWDHSFNYWRGAFDNARAAGALSVVDMATDTVPLSTIASGAYDGALRTWATQAASWGQPFLLRFDWEMNGRWFPWGTTSSNQNTAADYVAAWRHIHNLFAAAGATNTTWVWCPNLQYSTSVPYTQLYPGDAYVDWTCLDGYNSGISSTSFSSLYTQSYNSLMGVAPSKPVMIGEIGSIEYGAGVKAAWISDMLSQLPTNFPQVKALVYFNWRCLTSGIWRSWEIESSAVTQTAFSTGIAAPYYAAASSFTMPAALKPIQPLP